MLSSASCFEPTASMADETSLNHETSGSDLGASVANDHAGPPVQLMTTNTTIDGFEDVDEDAELESEWRQRRAEVYGRFGLERMKVPFHALANSTQDPNAGAVAVKKETGFQKKVRHDIRDYQGLMADRLRRIGGMDECDTKLEYTTDPAQAVIEGVLKLHKQRQLAGGYDPGDSNSESGVPCHLDEIDVQQMIRHLEDTAPREQTRAAAKHTNR